MVVMTMELVGLTATTISGAWRCDAAVLVRGRGRGKLYELVFM